MGKYFLRIILYILSFFYSLGVKIKSLFTVSKELEIKIVSVGNITLGGTGKTPTVIALAKDLRNKGVRVAVLSRGYRRKGSSLVVVSNGDKILVTAEEAGDEPYLLARKLEGVPVIVGRDRYTAGLLAIQKFDSRVAVLDDGFQHWSLKRDLDIVCLDSLTFLEDEPFFPLGTRRESVSALKRADLILLSNINLIDSEELKKWYAYLKKICPEVPVAESIHQPLGLHLLSNNSSPVNINFLQGKEVIVFSSLANPYAFRKTVEELGAKVVRESNFPDHHWYQEKDLLSLSQNPGLLVSTEKDEMKLKKFVSPEFSSLFARIYILDIELRIIRGRDTWEEKIKQVSG